MEKALALQRRVAEELLEKVGPRHSACAPDEDMLTFGLLQTMCFHDKFPRESCPDVMELLNGLKGEPDAELLAHLAERQRALIGRHLSTGQLIALGEGWFEAAALKNPTCSSIEKVLKSKPKVFRDMLDITAPSKYQSKKARPGRPNGRGNAHDFQQVVGWFVACSC